MNTESINPLIEISLSSVSDVFSSLSDDAKNQVRSAIEAFLEKKSSKEDASRSVQGLIHTSQPIDRLDEIIQTQEAPIPFHPSSLPMSKFGAGRNRTRAWGAYEDQRLLSGIYKYGLTNWSIVAQYVGNGRTKAQCSQRWFRGLDPRIEKTPWTSEEDHRLEQLVSQYGEKCWTRVAEEIGNRSDVQCRYRYLQLKKESCPTSLEESNRKGDDSRLPRQRQPKSKLPLSTAQPMFFPIVQGANGMRPPFPVQGGASGQAPSGGAAQPLYFVYAPMRMGQPVFMQQMPAGVFGQPQFPNGGMAFQGQKVDFGGVSPQVSAPGQMATGFQAVSALPSVPSPSFTQPPMKANSPGKKDSSDIELIHFEDTAQMNPGGGIFQAHQQSGTHLGE